MANNDPSPEESLARQIQQLLKPIPDDRADAARLDELRRIFARLYQEGELGGETSFINKQTSVSEQKWKSFLSGSFAKFRTQLSQRIVSGKRTAVRTLCGVVASSPKSVVVGRSKDSRKDKVQKEKHALLLDESILLQWVQAVSRVPVWDQSVQHMVQAEFLLPYRDVQYHVMSNVANVAASLFQKSKSMKEEDVPMQAERLIQILMMIPLVETEEDLESQQSYLFAPPNDAVQMDEENDENDDSDQDDEDESTDDSEDESADEGSPRKKQKIEQEGPAPRFSITRVKAHQKQWSKAWLAVLRLERLPKHCLKRALQFLPSRVLPVVGRPLMFADFFMNAYGSDESGILPILALDGLFHLMTKHGLEYPNYYKQLYKTIQPNLFSVKYKTRFFQLLDKSVSRNDLLPAHIVAAMGKRLLRCCLQAPPPGILIALVLVSNWFRQHPETSCLLHRTDTDKILDKYNATTDDPEQANALQSSLWELSALSRHYYPAVATMAMAVGTPEEAKLPLHSLDDYLQITYKTLLEQERKRQKKPSNNKKGNKSSTPLTFKPPQSGLFDSDDVFSCFMSIPTKETNKGKESA